MANKDKENVKRFVEGVSPEVAKEAYNGGGSSMKAVAYIDDGYPFTLTFECDDTSIETYADLVNYLKTKGYENKSDETKTDFVPALACACIGSPYCTSSSAITCMFADTQEIESQEVNVIYVNDTSTYISPEATVEITFLGNE